MFSDSGVTKSGMTPSIHWVSGRFRQVWRSKGVEAEVNQSCRPSRLFSQESRLETPFVFSPFTLQNRGMTKVVGGTFFLLRPFAKERQAVFPSVR